MRLELLDQPRALDHFHSLLPDHLLEHILDALILTHQKHFVLQEKRSNQFLYLEYQ